MTCGGLGGDSEDWIRCYGVSAFTCITQLIPHDLCWMEMVHPYLGLGLKEMG